jgi:hypothetical protein
MTMTRLASLLAVLAVAACCNKAAPTTTPAGGPGSGPMGDDVPAATIDLAKLGAECSGDQRCEVGACTSYFGIAGPSGPEFRSCEITCPAGKGCPAGTTCIQIADGPGAVCRPTEAPPPVEP